MRNDAKSQTIGKNHVNFDKMMKNPQKIHKNSENHKKSGEIT